MQAYHNDPKIKEFYVNRMKAHIEADELIRGTGFESGKGCAVGCTLNEYSHKQYPIELGIPEWLARVEDRLFEGMSLEKSKTFPLIFLESINVGADLNKIKSPFLILVLESTLNIFDRKKYPKVFEYIINVIDLYKNGQTDIELFRKAQNAAAAAYAAAAAAAYTAANAAAAAAYADAYAAANAAAYAAAAAAYTAANAAAAAAYADAYAAAKKNTYDYFAGKLIELIKECK